MAQSEYKNGEVHHKLGEHLVDVDYYARLDPSKPLEFEHEALKETVKATQLLPVGQLAVETFGFEGENARLAHESSVRIMAKYAQVNGRGTGRRKTGGVV